MNDAPARSGLRGREPAPGGPPRPDLRQRWRTRALRSLRATLVALLTVVLVAAGFGQSWAGAQTVQCAIDENGRPTLLTASSSDDDEDEDDDDDDEVVVRGACDTPPLPLPVGPKIAPDDTALLEQVELRAATGTEWVEDYDTARTPFTWTDYRFEPGAPYWLNRTIGANRMWRRGFTGTGVDVALIDSGVTEVPGLIGQVEHGPDFTAEAADPATAHIDTFGHGTHLAGLIAGRDGGASTRYPSSRAFTGIAPGSRVVSVKVADRDGVTDVGMLLDAIQWVVENRDTDGRNIGVLVLAFGIPEPGDYRTDPLAWAVEQAWQAGIVVVSAAGNEGQASDLVTSPGYDPYIITVGASDHMGTPWTFDDDVSDFSSAGDATRRPDFIVPATSVLSLRAPGSSIDQQNPGARVGDRFFRGSGTSQAAAIAAGAAALVLDQHPHATPDQVKEFLRSGSRLIGRQHDAQGAGQLHLARLWRSRPPQVGPQRHEPAAAPVGPAPVRDEDDDDDRDDDDERDDERDDDERDIDVAGASPAGNRWAWDRWAGNRWAGNRWAGNRWAGNRWASFLWAGGVES